MTPNFPTILPFWNASHWADEFQRLSKRLVQAKSMRRRDGDAEDAMHGLRISVYRDTVARVQAGGYELPGGTRVTLPLSPTIAEDTRFYSAECPAGEPAVPDAPLSPVEVVEGDCLAVARRLVEAGKSEVCVLNMASARNPGGGVHHGAGAQEEHLFRSSDYFRSLYQFVDYGREYGVSRAAESYPLDRTWGGVFSRGVTVFRGPEREGYPLLEHPWQCNFVAVAAVSHPATETRPDGEERLTPEMVEVTRRKIRTILRIARKNGQRTLVLSAFGCGAFRNPPRHMAELFREELSSPEFRSAFQHVYFAILNDHNAGSKGNFAPFREVFSE